jgi:hypothetical protein
VEPEITPEPSAEEREAIMTALAEIASGDGRRPVSDWWRQGLYDAVLGDTEMGEPPP